MFKDIALLLATLVLALSSLAGALWIYAG